jgi:hypothetical protein
MRFVKKPDLNDPEWVQWRLDAQKARIAMEQAVAVEQASRKQARITAELRKEANNDKNEEEKYKVKINAELYKRAMPFLLNLFNGKCAYCETVLAANQPGDVEHYRPKGRIKDEAGKIVTVVVDGEEIEHPGYWWLAYEWANLLPSCIDCNRVRGHGDDDEKAGKGEQFPVAGNRAHNPGDEVNEVPLLANPSIENFDPSTHFEFLENGRIRPLSEIGQVSCAVFGLNTREKLVGQRETAITLAKAALHSCMTIGGAMVFAETPDIAAKEKRLRIEVNNIWRGEAPYSAAARVGLTVYQRLASARGLNINLPFAI